MLSQKQFTGFEVVGSSEEWVSGWGGVDRRICPPFGLLAINNFSVAPNWASLPSCGGKWVWHWFECCGIGGK